MTAEPAKRTHRIFEWLPLIAILAIVAFLLLTSIRITRAAALQELPHADAIVVFGAAEYSGRPSPVLKARLDHALDLYHRGLASVVITTGGAAADPKCSR